MNVGMKNLVKRLSTLAWQMAHDRRYAYTRMMKYTPFLDLEHTSYWSEADGFYGTLDIQDRLVLDIGADMGITPAYFALNGSAGVLGFSLDRQYKFLYESISRLMKRKSTNAGL